MSDGRLETIDETLARELPDDVGESGQRVSEKNREEMLELLREAADELGESPTFRAFNELDLDVSGDVIANAFGTWNAAKERAGLETWERGDRGTRVPIEEDYSAEVDTPAKAYWLGTLVATSSISENEYGDNYQLQIVRTEDHGYFVEAFARAVDSGYQRSEYRTFRHWLIVSDSRSVATGNTFQDEI